MNKNGVHKMGLWGGVIGLIVIAVFVMLYFVGNKINEGAVGGTPKVVTAEDWVLGDIATAKAVLIEYSDFQCPACGSYYPTVKKIKEEFGDNLAFVYRHFPLSMIHK